MYINISASRERDGLAHVGVKHRGVRRVRVDVQEPGLVVAGRDRHDLDVAAGFEFFDLVGRQEDADIRVAVEDGGFLGRVVGHDADDDLLQLRRPDPVRVGLEDDVAARLPAVEDEWPDAHGGRPIPLGIIERAVFVEDRLQHMLGQHGLAGRGGAAEDAGQPGRKGLFEVDDQPSGLLQNFCNELGQACC